MPRRQDQHVQESVCVATPLAAQLRRQRVIVPRITEIQAYLAKFPALADVLPEICRKVRRGLGPKVELSLELYSDPEIDDRYLTIYVRQRDYDSQTMERIEKVSEQFEDLLDKETGFLLLTTDFRRPREKNVI